MSTEAHPIILYPLKKGSKENWIKLYWSHGSRITDQTFQTFVCLCKPNIRMLKNNIHSCPSGDTLRNSSNGNMFPEASICCLYWAKLSSDTSTAVNYSAEATMCLALLSSLWNFSCEPNSLCCNFRSWHWVVNFLTDVPPPYLGDSSSNISATTVSSIILTSWTTITNQHSNSSAVYLSLINSVIGYNYH